MEKTNRLMDLNPVIDEDIACDELGQENWHMFKLKYVTSLMKCPCGVFMESYLSVAPFGATITDCFIISS